MAQLFRAQEQHLENGWRRGIFKCCMLTAVRGVTQPELINRAKYVPLRLDAEERNLLRLYVLL